MTNSPVTEKKKQNISYIIISQNNIVIAKTK